LDNKDVIRQFEEIEHKVERVIEACKSHEATNLELINKIEGLEEELQKKTEAENKFLEERALIRSKIDSLLVRLEDITEVG
jgi:protein-arginine kinase activator protein McsA